MTRARTEKIPETAKTVPNCPSGEVRWVCLLPDPVTGLDSPVRSISGQPHVWVAPNREYAVRLVRETILPKAFHLASVISYVDWLARQETRQRAKLTHVSSKALSCYHNPNQICHRCGGTTPTLDSRYCDKCRRKGGRKKAQKQDGHAA